MTNVSRDRGCCDGRFGGRTDVGRRIVCMVWRVRHGWPSSCAPSVVGNLWVVQVRPPNVMPVERGPVRRPRNVLEMLSWNSRVAA